MAKDLRTFLAQVEATTPEEILRIAPEISVKWEATAVQVKLEKRGQFPVILCEAPVGEDGRRTPYRLITNVLADRKRCAPEPHAPPI
jgi:3-polyprenyl-4-hydroxybenzoate decarboxylase